MFVLYAISESRSVPLVKKEGEQKIYPGVYVTTGSDILDLYNEDAESPTAGWTWREINKDEFYVYDDAGYVFEVFNNSFEFLDEDYEKGDELFIVAYRLFRWFR